MLSREEALVVLKQHVTSESLIKHSMAVEASMRAYAVQFKQDIEKWGITGLLHDIDFEKYPEEHPYHARGLLEGLDMDEEMLDAIEKHGKRDQVIRESLLAKVLFGVDSLSSFVIAYIHVRPDKSFADIQLKSIKKKYKDKAFARAVDRELILFGANEMGIDLDTHMQNVVDGIVLRETELNAMNESLV